MSFVTLSTAQLSHFILALLFCAVTYCADPPNITDVERLGSTEEQTEPPGTPDFTIYNQSDLFLFLWRYRQWHRTKQYDRVTVLRNFIQIPEAHPQAPEIRICLTNIATASRPLEVSSRIVQVVRDIPLLEPYFKGIVNSILMEDLLYQSVTNGPKLFAGLTRLLPNPRATLYRIIVGNGNFCRLTLYQKALAIFEVLHSSATPFRREFLRLYALSATRGTQPRAFRALFHVLSAEFPDIISSHSRDLLMIMAQVPSLSLPNGRWRHRMLAEGAWWLQQTHPEYQPDFHNAVMGLVPTACIAAVAATSPTSPMFGTFEALMTPYCNDPSFILMFMDQLIFEVSTQHYKLLESLTDVETWVQRWSTYTLALYPHYTVEIVKLLDRIAQSVAALARSKASLEKPPKAD